MGIPVAVIGAGSFGTCLAMLCARQNEVRLWARNAGLAEAINRDRRNPRYLSGLADALIILDPDRAATGWVHRLSAGTRAERREAARALGQLGSRARDAVPYLITASRGSVDSVAIEAIMALGNVGPGAATAIPSLEDLSRRGTGKIRDVARASLEQIRSR